MQLLVGKLGLGNKIMVVQAGLSPLERIFQIPLCPSFNKSNAEYGAPSSESFPTCREDNPSTYDSKATALMAL